MVTSALGAGKADATYAPLMEETTRLVAEGIDARFFDLGDVGHTYAAENTDPRSRERQTKKSRSALPRFPVVPSRSSPLGKRMRFEEFRDCFARVEVR